MSRLTVANIVNATCRPVKGRSWEVCAFDSVDVRDASGFEATLFLPAGTGEAVAAAIRAAIATEARDVPVAAE